MLLILVVFWMCCDAADDKSELIGLLLRNYEKDAEPPPLADGVNKTTVTMSLTLICATPVGDLVSIESWTSMVSSVGALSSCKGDQSFHWETPKLNLRIISNPLIFQHQI